MSKKYNPFKVEKIIDGPTCIGCPKYDSGDYACIQTGRYWDHFWNDEVLMCKRLIGIADDNDDNELSRHDYNKCTKDICHDCGRNIKSEQHHEQTEPFDPSLYPKEKAAYDDMIARCYDPNHPLYPEEGGCGISVNDSWLNPINGFENFIKDMGPIPEGCVGGIKRTHTSE